MKSTKINNELLAEVTVAAEKIAKRKSVSTCVVTVQGVNLVVAMFGNDKRAMSVVASDMCDLYKGK